MKLVCFYFLCILLIHSSFGNPCRKIPETSMSSEQETPCTHDEEYRGSSLNIFLNLNVAPRRIYNIIVKNLFNILPDLPNHSSQLPNKTSRFTLSTTTEFPSQETDLSSTSFSPITSYPAASQRKTSRFTLYTSTKSHSKKTHLSSSTFSPISSDPVYSTQKSFHNNNFKSDFNPTKHRNWKLINDEKCGTNSEYRIVGGENASLGQYPWIARVGYSKKGDGIVFKCGATLISRRHVVTAAHCTVDLPESLKIAIVRLGEYNTQNDIDCVEDLCADPHKDYDVIEVIVHKEYGKPKNRNDIALIKLNETVKFTEWITPICLPFGSLLQKNLTGSKVDIAGWGLYDISTSKESVILQTVKLPVIETSVCVNKFRRYSIEHNNQLCVGGIIGKDSCSGDSGGPLMKVEVEGGDGPKFYLFGIVSFGATLCGMTTNPAIYTKIVSYMKWILDNINSV